MNWNKIALGELVNITKGKKHTETDDTSGFRYLQIEDLNGHFTKKYTKESGTYVNERDIVIAWDGANAGKVGCGLSGMIGSTLARLTFIKSDVEPKFVKRYLDHKFEYIKSKRIGATIPHVSSQALKGLLIPLPSFKTQLKIASILDQADTLRQKDQQMLKKYDELLQSEFYKMFGNPAKNDKAWNIQQIRDIVSEVKYGTSKPAEENGFYPYLRMNNITYSGDWDFSDMKFINLDEKEREKYIVAKGDLVFNRTNSKELVGKTAVYDQNSEMVIAGYLIRVRTNDFSNPYYISGFLNSKYGKAMLRGLCKNIIGMANINAQELQNIRIPVPPRPLQDQFENKFRKIKQLKELAVKQADNSENLFQSLLQKAFKGEIVD